MTSVVSTESELVRTRNRPPGRLRSRRPSLDLVLIAFLGAHVPLGVLMDSSAPLARMHGLAAAAFVLGGSLFFKRISYIIYGLCYLVAAGVLWRMTEAGLPWEISKHGVTFVSIVTLYRFRRRLPDPLPILYFVLLLPAAAITFMELGLVGGRRLVVFNLSGPLALAAGAALFSVIRLEPIDLRRMTYMMVAPLMSVWIIALQALLTVERFTTSSSKEAVGGFGPNQVSTVLGFGGLIALLWVMRERRALHRLVLFSAGLALLAQSTLTFSRGGLYNAIAALLMVGLLYLRRPSRILGALVIASLVAVGGIALFGRIDEFTGGKFGERFSDTDVTGRDDIAAADFEVWASAPVTGVGPGRAKFARESGQEEAAAHTEFTRLLAEHGLLGLFALGTLGLIAARNLRGRVELWEQAWAAGLMVWSAAAMTNAAMRVGLVSFAFALAAARLVAPRPVVPEPEYVPAHAARTPEGVS